MSRDPNLVRAVGTVDGVNQDFDTPDAYIAGTVWHYLNGILVDRDDPVDGLTEIGGTSVRLLIAPETDDDLYFYYFTGQPQAHGYPTPPRAQTSYLLEPMAQSTVELKPESASNEDISPAEYVPDPHAHVVLSPMGTQVIELVPKPVSIEEV